MFLRWSSGKRLINNITLLSKSLAYPAGLLHLYLLPKRLYFLSKINIHFITTLFFNNFAALQISTVLSSF